DPHTNTSGTLRPSWVKVGSGGYVLQENRKNQIKRGGRKMKKLVLGSLFSALVFGLATQANAETTWERVKGSGELRTCVIKAGQPHSFVNDQGEWEGLSVDMAQDLSKMMEVNLTYHETTWGTAVLDLQSDKCDIVFGLNASP